MGFLSSTKNRIIVGATISILAVIIIIAIVVPKPKQQDESQLWMLTTNDSKLENGYFWEWEDKTWSSIPSENMESFIEDSSGQVLTIDGNNVTLNEKLNSSESQKWIRGPTNSEGYFTIKHKASGKFLTNDIDDKNGGTITKDFVNRKFDNQLGVYQDDLNIGGSGISGGHKGCYGQAHTQPKFRRGDIEKISEIGWKKVFKIFGNRKTKRIWITGTCCWEITGKNQKKHTLERGDNKKPPIGFHIIKKLETKKCS